MIFQKIFVEWGFLITKYNETYVSFECIKIVAQKYKYTQRIDTYNGAKIKLENYNLAIILRFFCVKTNKNSTG